MIESSHKQENWYSMDKISRFGSGWVIKDLLIRWNEQQVTVETDIAPRTEYVYDAYRFDYLLPVEVEPGLESVAYYLEAAKSAMIALAQAMVTQEEGFNAD